MTRDNILDDPSIAIIVDPQTNKIFGGLQLTGELMPDSEWLSASGELHSFEILGDRLDLWDVWIHQKEVLLRNGTGQRLVKIMTYPTEGEKQGYLDYVGVFERFPAESKPQRSTLRGLAFLQSLLGA